MTYVTIEELEKLAASTDTDDNAVAVRNYYKLDHFINSKSSYIRGLVADMRYGLDVLINDPDPLVRCHVVRQGYGLEILVNDSDFMVRQNVAMLGYGLEKLVNDPDSLVRNDAIFKSEHDVIIVAEQWGFDKQPMILNIKKDRSNFSVEVNCIPVTDMQSWLALVLKDKTLRAEQIAAMDVKIRQILTDNKVQKITNY